MGLADLTTYWSDSTFSTFHNYISKVLLLKIQ